MYHTDLINSTLYLNVVSFIALTYPGTIPCRAWAASRPAASRYLDGDGHLTVSANCLEGGASETWLNRIRSPSQTRDNIQRYHMKLLDPNEFFYSTFQTQFLRLLLLKKVADCGTVRKGTSLDIYSRKHRMG